MLFPNSARNAIKNAFYDKTISILSSTETIDAEGGVVKSAPTVKSTFQGNARFNALGELQQEIGLIHSIDIAISCPPETEVEVGDLIQYGSVKYVAVDVIPYDSHKLITGEKWVRE